MDINLIRFWFFFWCHSDADHDLEPDPLLLIPEASESDPDLLEPAIDPSESVTDVYLLKYQLYEIIDYHTTGSLDIKMILLQNKVWILIDSTLKIWIQLHLTTSVLINNSVKYLKIWKYFFLYLYIVE